MEPQERFICRVSNATPRVYRFALENGIFTIGKSSKRYFGKNANQFRLLFFE